MDLSSPSAGRSRGVVSEMFLSMSIKIAFLTATAGAAEARSCARRNASTSEKGIFN